MKSLAELKRKIKIGTKIKKYNGLKQNSNNTIRIVDKVQTNAFTMNGSWLWYPKNKNLIEFNGNKFKIYNPNYRQLNEEEKAIFREYKNNCYAPNAYKSYREKLKKMNKLYLTKAYFEDDYISCPFEKGTLIGKYEIIED